MNITKIPFNYVGGSASTCGVNGVSYECTDWQMPETISRAIGMGCSGSRYFCISGTMPVAHCETYFCDGEPYLVCTQIEVERIRDLME